MSLPDATRTMLTDEIANNQVADANITYGSRNEFASLPAITYQIIANETIATGATPLRRCEVQIKSVALVAEDAQGISALVESALVVETYNGIEFQAIANKNSILQEPESGLGDETNPFVCITTADIFYKG